MMPLLANAASIMDKLLAASGCREPAPSPCVRLTGGTGELATDAAVKWQLWQEPWVYPSRFAVL